MTDEKAKAPVTASDLREILSTFYSQVIRPEVKEMIHTEIQTLRSEMHDYFDDLYKKFEDLRQEYIIANEQMKRLENSDDVLREELRSLKSKVSGLSQRIEVLEKHLETH
ncbi:MAG TPA: hypothetical protein DF383_09860 [Deltaproteobacteria bacterium]|nr:hypothetical protein [Deltaproteobacteria bacterium]